MSTTHCAEVLSRAPAATGGSLPRAAVLLVHERVEGFFLERLNDRGESVGTTQHDTMDEAVSRAYCEYVLADWTSCPDDADPLEYIRSQHG